MKQKADASSDGQSEAERFVDFARKLVNVPKEEIDQKQAEYHKKRIAERKAALRPIRTKPSKG
ncbi:MAG: hypothetical protein AABO57_01980 [Acidobacteriota bacterium]